MATIDMTGTQMRMDDYERVDKAKDFGKNSTSIQPKLPSFADLMASLNKDLPDESELTFNDYQALAIQTAVFPGRGDVGGAMYLALGLCGESGEVAEKIKKYFRDGIPDGVDPDDWIENLVKEVGDVLWYAANLLNVFGVSFSDAGVMNLEKLASRQARGVLGGSGDNR